MGLTLGALACFTGQSYAFDRSQSFALPNYGLCGHFVETPDPLLLPHLLETPSEAFPQACLCGDSKTSQVSLAGTASVPVHSGLIDDQGRWLSRICTSSLALDIVF